MPYVYPIVKTQKAEIYCSVDAEQICQALNSTTGTPWTTGAIRGSEFEIPGTSNYELRILTRPASFA